MNRSCCYSLKPPVFGAITFTLNPLKRRAQAKILVVSKQRLPKHISVIPDGNRRWAVARGIANSKAGALPTRVRFLHRVNSRYVVVEG
jgi:hypothetical protein